MHLPKRAGEQRFFLPFVICTVLLSTSSLPQKRSWSFPVDFLWPPQWPGDRSIHGCLFSWQFDFPGSTLLHSCLNSEPAKALPWELKASGHTRAEQPVRVAPGTKENYLPREANTAGAVSTVSIPLFCVIKGPIVEAQITQRWHVQCLITY